MMPKGSQTRWSYTFHDEPKSKANPAFKDIDHHRMLFREKHILGSFYKGFCLNVMVQPQGGVNVATFIFSGATVNHYNALKLRLRARESRTNHDHDHDH